MYVLRADSTEDAHDVDDGTNLGLAPVSQSSDWGENPELDPPGKANPGRSPSKALVAQVLVRIRAL